MFVITIPLHTGLLLYRGGGGGGISMHDIIIYMKDV